MYVFSLPKLVATFKLTYTKNEYFSCNTQYCVFVYFNILHIIHDLVFKLLY